MSLPMHTQTQQTYILETCFRFYRDKTAKTKEQQQRNENKKFNTMANDIIAQHTVSGLLVHSLICCERPVFVVVAGFSMKLSHATEILTALITDSMALCFPMKCSNFERQPKLYCGIHVSE